MKIHSRKQLEKAAVSCGLMCYPLDLLPTNKIVGDFNEDTGKMVYYRHGNNKQVRCMKRTLASMKPEKETREQKPC